MPPEQVVATLGIHQVRFHNKTLGLKKIKGSQFEKGKSFSDGQQQLTCIARSLARHGGQILLPRRAHGQARP